MPGRNGLASVTIYPYLSASTEACCMAHFRVHSRNILIYLGDRGVAVPTACVVFGSRRLPGSKIVLGYDKLGWAPGSESAEQVLDHCFGLGAHWIVGKEAIDHMEHFVGRGDTQVSGQQPKVPQILRSSSSRLERQFSTVDQNAPSTKRSR